MTRQRFTQELLERAAREASTWDEAVRLCGGDPTGDSRRYLRKKLLDAEIDFSHLQSGQVRHTEDALRTAVANSNSIQDVVRHLGISNVGGNQAHIGRRIAAHGIDTSHFTQAKRRPKGALGDPLTLRPREEPRIPGKRLRRELLRLGVPEQCAMCERTYWCEQQIPLEVDHINGDWWDNRPGNLRLLCPNCHATTDTYRGRRRRST
ncbi:HNH endonuclease signature motif containing protein [Streptomyces mesophilus]|uniref:HNH endonuclease signature motif containing protein n=1 Tax=Streptomyces mesophilus TaxID=1775132 RepID=UPI0033333055